ncbi:TonB-dependent receptor [Salidesulfovibrio onnuriiensis]|uniref:TonB-dependent receptor n=1 Tax=Salidesulfovibrio onnuriiensis TaxID=2583823 RepID=UPI0011CAD8D4|nr:TonB-dependent receptor [Salidesulfovibrio onnuriiensis]
MRRIAGFMALLAALALVCAAAPCARAGQEEKKEDLRLEPVVVNAEKRSEEVQDVPASITVLEEGDLRDMGIKNTDDLARHVPGLEFNDFGSRRHGLMFLRGIKNLPTTEPSTGYYVDGVNYSKPYMFNFPLFDVERVEVLKGPQGALYGRNTVGGVINVLTRQPGNEVVFSAGTTLGNFGQKEVRGNWSGPLVEDRLFLGIYGMAAARDGFMENDVDTGGKDGRYQDGKAARMKLRYLANPDWELGLILDAQQHDDGAYSGRRTSRNSLVKAGAVGTDSRYHYSHDFDGSQENECWGATLNSVYETGLGSFHSITGYRDYDSDEDIDADFSPLDVMRKQYVQRDQDFSQEFRLNSSEGDGPLEWLVGTSFFNLHSRTEVTNRMGADHAAPGMKVAFDTDRHNMGASAFGQGTYTFWERFDLTLGLRYEYEHADVDAEQLNTPAGGPASVAASHDGAMHFGALLPKVSLAWHLDDDHMLYGTISRAHRSGGFNDASAPSGKEAYAEEYSWLYEVGLKSMFMDGRLMFNLSGFYTSIDDEQLPLFKTGTMQSYIDNAGKSYRTGIEIESRYRLTEELGLDANFSWIEARFEEYEDPAVGADYAGNRVFLVPNYTYGLGLDYRHALNGDWNLVGRADITGVGSRYFDDGNTVEENPYDLVDLRFGVEGEHLACTLWVKNVFDKEYTVFENTTAGIAEDGAPRTFGMSLDYSF